VPLTQDIVTNTITERMDALRNGLKAAHADGNFGCAVAFCGSPAYPPTSADLLGELQRDTLSFPAQRIGFGLFGFSPSFAAPSA
jgi:hypothetical protein